MNTFKPYRGLAPLAVTLNGTTQVVQLGQVARSNDAIRVIVSGATQPRIQPGTDSSEASSTISNGSLMLANSVETFTLDEGISHIAVSGDAGSSLEIHLGTGF